MRNKDATTKEITLNKVDGLSTNPLNLGRSKIILGNFTEKMFLIYQLSPLSSNYYAYGRF
jgi:hypothetical protein